MRKLALTAAVFGSVLVGCSSPEPVKDKVDMASYKPASASTSLLRPAGGGGKKRPDAAGGAPSASGSGQ